MNYSRILLVAFCLLALATPAWPECAWIMWTAPLRPDGLWYSTDLRMGWGYDKREECAQAAENILKRGKAMAMCLPDNADPRGGLGRDGRQG